MELKLDKDSSKQEVFETVKSFLDQQFLEVTSSDQNRPWGGFYVIDEAQSNKFIELFFKDVAGSKITGSGKLSPKILLVEPGKRLSWQYHHRRAEIWKVIAGEVSVVQSDSDVETAPQPKKKDEIIVLKQGERHRLIGTNSWGIIAEIWQHTDNDNPSDEEDIVRVQDDFGR
jgi:mannose-6-phosphate isomerase-like protein (cupin superfamily)